MLDHACVRAEFPPRPRPNFYVDTPAGDPGALRVAVEDCGNFSG
jgi:hypothetical protein